jgi:CO/xanthine dehydrogenase Mo-binding subunit
MRTALDPATPVIHASLGDNLAFERNHDAGKVDAAFADSDEVVEAEFVFGRHTGVTLEPRAVVADWHAAEARLTIYQGTQAPHMVQNIAALHLGLQESQVRVVCKDVGGSFGQKTQVWREEYAVIVAGLILRRPVKWIEDRFEHFIGANQAREQECTLRLAFDQGARLLGAQMHYLNDNGAYPHYPDQTLGVAMFMWGAYRLPRFEFLLQGLHTNTVGLGGYRGPWAIETLVRMHACPKCGAEVDGRPRAGRPRVWCSKRCRDRPYMARAMARLRAEPLTIDDMVAFLNRRATEEA